jgi:excisionase family DNA binding protein
MSSLLSLKELARELKVSTRTIYRWVKANAIPHYKLPLRHNQKRPVYRFRREEVLESLRAG